MKFGDRLGCRDPVQAAIRYWTHLANLGFSPRNDLYRYFAAEVFHDGEVSIRAIDLNAGSVVLRLNNHHATGIVCVHRQKHGKGWRKVMPKDFITDITFSGVELFEIKQGPWKYPPTCQCAELSKKGNMLK